VPEGGIEQEGDVLLVVDDEEAVAGTFLHTPSIGAGPGSPL
jgi:hypothetical protein